VGGFIDPVTGILDNCVKAVGLVGGALGPVGLAMSAGGAYMIARRGAWRNLLVLAVLIGASMASKIGMGILDPSNPDDHGYFLVGIAGTAVLSASFGALLVDGSALLDGVSARILGLVGGAAMLTVALMPMARGFQIAEERASFMDTYGIGTLVLDEQPPRTAMFVSHYPVLFMTQYLQLVEGYRPDVTIAQESLYQKARGGIGYAARLAELDHDLDDLVRDFTARGTLDWTDILALAASGRPVRVEASRVWEGLYPPLEFAGWCMSVSSDDDIDVELSDITRQALGHIRRVRHVIRGWSDADIETRRVVLRNLASSARFLGAQGYGRAAGVLVSAALKMNPDDRILNRMAVEFLGGAAVSR